ncbi:MULTISPECIES: hypothetical protein [Pseudomonas]|jgi:hypothetical protein|uniref:hypothetical protein n=1 Tax=Pseudomonas TaxID=286 RepID=UPI0021692D82|nr:hypothetical protein [Pseudomonas grimontii]MCS3514983.1 hypothetical protein [Pseudomonas grimontii]
MLLSIHHTMNNDNAVNVLQQSELHQRQKSDVEPNRKQSSTIEFGGPAASDRHKSQSTLDSLGGTLL